MVERLILSYVPQNGRVLSKLAVRPCGFIAFGKRLSSVVLIVCPDVDGGYWSTRCMELYRCLWGDRLVVSAPRSSCLMRFATGIWKIRWWCLHSSESGMFSWHKYNVSLRYVQDVWYWRAGVKWRGTAKWALRKAAATFRCHDFESAKWGVVSCVVCLRRLNAEGGKTVWTLYSKLGKVLSVVQTFFKWCGEGKFFVVWTLRIRCKWEKLIVIWFKGHGSHWSPVSE